MTFKMKSAVVLSLFLNICFSLSLPLSIEDISDQTKKSPQADSAPIALLLLLPSNITQSRENEEETPAESETISLVEDLLKMLLRDADINEDDLQTDQREETFITEDLRPFNSLLREDRGVNLLEEPSKTESATNIPNKDEEDEASFLAVTLSSSEDSLTREDEKGTEVMSAENPLPPLVGTLNESHDEGRFSLEMKSIKDHPSKRSYSEYAEVNTPTITKPYEQIVATYPDVHENAIPILLNCAPKVQKGHLAKAAPSYRNHGSKVTDNLLAKTAVMTRHENLKNDFIDARNIDVLDLNSPASMIAMDRRRRMALPKTGVTHYKVSEDYPETFNGNHHLVSADYPQPNMVRITNKEYK